MVRCVVSVMIVVIVFGVQSMAASDEYYELPPDFPAAAPFVSAAKGRLRVQTRLVNSGEIVVVVSLRNVRTKASLSASLPNETERPIGDWWVRFVVVPMLSEREVRDIRKFVDRIPGDKSHISQRAALSKNIPDVWTSTHAYRIELCPVVPVEQHDRNTVSSFVHELFKVVRSSERTFSEKRLRNLLSQ